MSDEALVIMARDVRKTYGHGTLATEVLQGVCLELRLGELCCVIGPSGSGKSTLLSILAGLLAPSAGTVQLCGVNISDENTEVAREVRRSHLGFIFQHHNLFRSLTALENIVEALCLRGVPRAAAKQRAQDALAAVNLEHRAHHRPATLSGGERQRVGVARAIASQPKLYIADEPTASLDSKNGREVLALLRSDVKNSGRAALVVSHDARLIPLADRVLEIREGRLYNKSEPKDDA